MKSLDTLPEAACRQILAEYGPGRSGRTRAVLLSVLFAALLGTGLYMEFLAMRNWNAGEVVLILHIVLGLPFAALFFSWIAGHVARGLPKSRRSGFTWLSWLLLATYLVVIVTGLMMVLPTLLYLGGVVWFWRFETTHVLTFLHLWVALAAGAGLVAHLALRHWQAPAARRTERGS